MFFFVKEINHELTHVSENHEKSEIESTNLRNLLDDMETQLNEKDDVILQLETQIDGKFFFLHLISF